LNFLFSIISIGTCISILFTSTFFEKIKPKISYTLAIIFFGILISIIFSNKLIGNNLNFTTDWNLVSILFIVVLTMVPLISFFLNYWKPRFYFYNFNSLESILHLFSLLVSVLFDFFNWSKVA
jgi:hypothetical protein